MTTTTARARPAGPTWTRARLVRVMRLRFGTARHDPTYPDTAAAAAALGVHRSTIQRWLRAPHGRSLAHIPPRRLQDLITTCLPDPETLAAQADEAVAAAAAIEHVRAGLINNAWVQRQWLHPHVVMILRPPEHQIRQLTITRDDPDLVRQAHDRGQVLAAVQVPTRFHGVVLVHTVLDRQGPWRFRALNSQVVRGYTYCWLDDAPPVDLAALAADLPPRPTSRTQRLEKETDHRMETR